MVMRALILICALALATMPAVAQDEATDSTGPGVIRQESTTPIHEMSQEEMDAELERVEEALGDEDEVTEFTPAKPLPADLSVALPSDI